MKPTTFLYFARCIHDFLDVEMKKTLAAVQSNYIPWKGYFDLINMVDEFVLYDDVQYTKDDWRNRNQIKTKQGLLWLTIPVRTSGRFGQQIQEVVVSQNRWNEKHWRTFVMHYTKAPHFETYRSILEALYLDTDTRYLSRINHKFILAICDILGIDTDITWVMDYELQAEDKTERLVELCRKSGATTYLSGPAAKSYMKESLFEQAGIQVQYMNYSGYPEYDQLYPPFEHAVSVLDLIFSVGDDAPRYMKSFRRD